MRIAKLCLLACVGPLLCSRSWRFGAAIFAGLVLTACSTHPLPEDVIDLPVHEIVHRIQCEAAREVGAQLATAHLTYAYKELKDLDGRVKKLRTSLKGAQEKLEEAESDYGKSHAELQDAFDSVDLQIEQVLQKISKLESELALLESDPEIPAERKDQRKEQIDNLLSTLKTEAGQLYGQHKRIVAVGTLLSAVDTAATDPKLVEVVAEQKKKYEEKRIKDVIAFQGNNALFQFVFQATENNNATSMGTITWPIDLGVITLGYAVGDRKKRASDRQVRLIVSFGELIELVDNCWDVDVPEERRFPRRYPITGEIGLAEVISDYIRVTAVKGGKFQPAGSAGDSYRDKITFTTIINGGLTPGINLSKRMGQLIQASADLNADRTDVHELTIFLTPPGGKTAGSPQEIIIRELPAIRVRARSVEQSPAGL